MMFWHKGRHLAIQVSRRCMQVAVVLLLVAIGFMSLYAHYRAARAIEDAPAELGWKGDLLVRVDNEMGDVENAQAFLDDTKGTLWSMRLGGVEWSDPLAAAEMFAASRTIHLPMLMSILLPVVLTLLLGKVFCSWLCPANLLLELTGTLRRLLRLAEIPPAEVRFSRNNKYILLAIGLLAAGIVGLPMFALVYPPAVLSRLAHAWVFGTALTGMLVLIGVIAVFELFVSPRWWCRTMCPGGALYGLIGWPRLLRVKLHAESCTGCGECEPACEPGLNPVAESRGIECDNCGACVRRCPERALSFTIGLPATTNGGSGKGFSSSPKKTPVVAALLLVGLLARPAEAHHILGLPHYSYKENYPQAPTLEYPATTGPYDVLLTSNPGKPVPGERANLAFYIKNRATGRPYDRPITIRVLQTFTFGQNREVLPPTVVQPFEQPHKVSAVMPDEGEYIIELSMDVEGAVEVIPFMMVAGDPTATLSIVIAIGAGLVVFLVVVRAIRIKRKRRAAMVEQAAQG